MGEALLIKKSKSVKNKIFAIISVAYPENATCTCSKGNIVLSDENTNGKVIFNIPEAGTWTVSCSNEEGKVSSEIIEITPEEGQFREVTLSFKPSSLIIFDSSVTSGWATKFSVSQAQYVSTINISGGKISFDVSSGTASGMSFYCLYHENTKRSLNGYTTLKATVDSFSTSRSGASGALVLQSTATASQSGVALAKFTKSGTVSLDIPSNASSVYVGICSTDGVEFKISKIWLE